MAWLTGWQYRKSHVINSANNAGTNYQVKIVAHYGTGTDNAGNVYLNNHARSDFGDVRFTSSDQTTLLDYWMESKTDNDNAVFWVEVSDNLSVANVTIYIYYGKSDATTTSNGDNTFPMLFCDGTGTFTDLWTEEQVNGNADYYNNELRTQVTTTGGSGTYGRAKKTNYIAYPVWLTLRWKEVEKSGWASTVRKAIGLIKDGSTWYIEYAGVPNNGLYVLYTAPTSLEFEIFVGGTEYDKGTKTVGSGDNTIEIYYNPSTGAYKVVVDGTTLWSGTQSPLLTGLNYRPYFNAYYYLEDYFADDIYCRKYVDPEPAHGAWGSEETSGQQITRSVTELLGGYDVKSRIANLYRIKVDYVGLLDSKYKKLSKIFNDYIGLLDTKTKQLAKSITEYVGLLDTKIKTLSKVTTEKIALLDMKSRIASLHRTFTEQLAIVESKVKSLGKTFTEYLGLLDSSIRGLVGYIYRTVTEYIGLLDIKTKTLSKIVKDYIGIIDTRIIKKSLHKIIVEYLGIKDIYYRFYYILSKWRRFQHPKQHVEVES
jgi:hypothetical protein